MNLQNTLSETHCSRTVKAKDKKSILKGAIHTRSYLEPDPNKLLKKNYDRIENLNTDWT